MEHYSSIFLASSTKSTYSLSLYVVNSSSSHQLIARIYI